MGLVCGAWIAVIASWDHRQCARPDCSYRQRMVCWSDDDDWWGGTAHPCMADAPLCELFIMVFYWSAVLGGWGDCFYQSHSLLHAFDLFIWCHLISRRFF